MCFELLTFHVNPAKAAGVDVTIDIALTDDLSLHAAGQADMCSSVCCRSYYIEDLTVTQINGSCLIHTLLQGLDYCGTTDYPRQAEKPRPFLVGAECASLGSSRRSRDGRIRRKRKRGVGGGVNCAIYEAESTRETTGTNSLNPLRLILKRPRSLRSTNCCPLRRNDALVHAYTSFEQVLI
jgi:hypothetical protein